MKRLLLFCLLLGIFDIHAASATNPPNNERRPFEENYYEIGYKSAEQALKECEKHFGREIKLPIGLPPVEFTHRFGRCNNLDGVIKDDFEIEYLNENQGKNHFMIEVNPLEHKLKGLPRKRDVIRTYKLKDGTEAVYGTTPSPKSFNLLVFERDGWQYIFSVDKRIEDKVLAKTLVDIAESVEKSKIHASDIPDTEAKMPKEKASQILIVSLLAPYTTKPIKNHYGEALPWQLEHGEITDTKMIYSTKGVYFIVKLKVQPFVGAHDPVGTDLFTFKMKDMKITLENYEHLESFPIKPYLRKYYPNLKSFY